MGRLKPQLGFALIPYFVLVAWLATGVCVSVWAAEAVGFQVFQSNLRTIALSVAAGVVMPGYLFSNLRDLRKQVKEDGLFLKSREVANLNHIVTQGNRKAVGMLVLFPLSSLYIGIGSLLDVESEVFNFFISGFGFFISLCIASIVISSINLWEIAKFEEKMSNSVKRHKSSAALLNEFRSNDRE